jgi:WD40 repeat protein
VLRILQNALAGAVVIAALVAAGTWFANDPEMRHFGLSQTGLPQDRPPAAREAPPADVSVNFVDWSANGRTLLSLSRGKIGALSRLTLHLLEEETTTIPIDTMQQVVTTAALAPDGRHVLVGSVAGRLWWIETESSDAPTRLIDMAGSETFTATAIADDGRLVAAGTDQGSIGICDLARQTYCNLPTSRNASVKALRFSRDGKSLVSAHSDGQISVWDLETRTLSQGFAGHAQPAVAAAFLSTAFYAEGTQIISAGLDDTVRIWDIATGRQLWLKEFDLSAVTTLAVSADETLAAWGGYNRRIVVWDLQAAEQKFEIVTPAYVVFHLKFSPDGSLLAAAGTEGLVRLYDMRTAAELNEIDVAGVVRARRSEKVER